MLSNLWRTRRVPIMVGAAVLVAAIVATTIALASGGSGKKAKKGAGATTTTTARPKTPRVAPLTGLPDPSGASFKRPAVTVKINNTSAAKQSGVDQADVVYEEVVEGGITRLAAIFNSHAPDRVGPVRSVRKTDPEIVWPIRGIFAYSGGAQYAIDSIDQAPVKQLDETRAGSMMFRDPPDPSYAPFNLWAHVDQMFGAGGKPIPPPPLFTYRKAGTRVGGTPVASFDVGFANGYATSWQWDAKSGTWLRSKFGEPDVDAQNVRIAPKNVVVMMVQYQGGAGVEGAEATLTGSGDAMVFTAGKEIKAKWTRPNLDTPAKLTNLAGATIALTPGQTWVELPDVSYPITVHP